jgi:peptidoglycan/LPS O-acetylase OafA/YrhL
MALFFCLSGFLITTFLLRRGNVRDFLIRRTCRIVPLAWLTLPIGLLIAHAAADAWLPNFLFVANFPPFRLTPVTAHFWSLCVEIQFYGAVALAFGLFGRRGLAAGVVVGALFVTGLRIYTHTYSSIVTYLRIDEVLAGGVLALVHAGEFGAQASRLLRAFNPPLMFALLFASTLPICGPLNYARPYLAAALVGCTLMQSESTWNGMLESPLLAYVAEISYALYILHPLLADTWLGSGTKLVKYAKRPLLVAATVVSAHVSTRFYEHRWMTWGKSLSARYAHGASRAPAPQSSTS